jgi:hypothetical protein
MLAGLGGFVGLATFIYDLSLPGRVENDGFISSLSVEL